MTATNRRPGATAVIILDTNVARIDLNSADAEILKVIAATGHQKVAVPWMVMEELAAQRAIVHRDAWQKAVSAIADLKRHRPWSEKVGEIEIGAEDGERSREHWRARYGELYETIPTSEAALREGFVREANRTKPAKDSDRKGGGRDVAIWLSVVEYLRDNPQEHVYFVTENKKDFGDGSGWPPPMDQDIRGLEERITLLRDRAELIATLTPLVDDIPDGVVWEILDRSSVRASVASLAVTQNIAAGINFPWRAVSFSGLLGLFQKMPDISSSYVDCFVWVRPPSVTPLRVTNAQGRRIGSQVWYTADVDWLLAGSALARVHGGIPAMPVGCKWRTRVLASEIEDGPVTVLLGQLPTVLAPEDAAMVRVPDGPFILEQGAHDAVTQPGLQEIRDAARRLGDIWQVSDGPLRWIELLEELTDADSSGFASRKLVSSLWRSQRIQPPSPVGSYDDFFGSPQPRADGEKEGHVDK